MLFTILLITWVAFQAWTQEKLTYYKAKMLSKYASLYHGLGYTQNPIDNQRFQSYRQPFAMKPRRQLYLLQH